MFMTQSHPTISMPIPYSADVVMSNEGVRTQFCVKNYPNHPTSPSR